MINSLTPSQHHILEIITKNKEISISALIAQTESDRGTIEAAIGSLLAYNLITKNEEVYAIYELTDRGKQVLNSGLPERLILHAIENQEQRIGDLDLVAGLDKQDLSAGIGILKKLDLIYLKNGLVSVKSRNWMEIDTIEKGLKNLKELSKDEDKDLITLLRQRKFIEEDQSTIVTIRAILTQDEVAELCISDAVSRLSPKIISDGLWRDMTFKTYSLATQSRKLNPGKYQPYRQFIVHLKQKLVGLGFTEMKGPIVETEFWNFDALYAPQDHPSREESDIFLLDEPTYGRLPSEDYVDFVKRSHEDGWTTGSKGHRYHWDPQKAARLLLRPHGTAVSARELTRLKPPAKFFHIGRVYRPDEFDATHALEFYQIDAIVCDKTINFTDLLGLLKIIATEVAGAEEVRFRPDYFPFTSPSVELSAKHSELGYIEFGGAGILRPEVTKSLGVNYPVIAWGLGVGRLFMTKYKIKDIRDLYSQNLKWLRSQKVYSGL